MPQDPTTPATLNSLAHHPGKAPSRASLAHAPRSRMRRPFLATTLGAAIAWSGAAAPLSAQDVVGGSHTAPSGLHETRGGRKLAWNSITTGLIQKADATVTYTFQGGAGKLVDLALSKVAGFEGAFVQATVVTPSGDPLATLIKNEFESFVLPEAGTYQVQVTAAKKGTFRLSLGCAGKGDVAMLCGELLEESLALRTEFDYFTFEGTADDFVQIILVETGGFDDSAPRGTLFAPSGTKVESFDADSATGVTLTETGPYLIRVRANDVVGTGTYNLGLGCLPPVGATPLVCGDPPQNDLLSSSGAVRYFTYDGGVGDVVDVLIISNAEYIPQVRVFDPLGLEVMTFTSDSLQPLELPDLGTYTLEVKAANLAGFGEFSLGMNCRPPAGTATPLVCGGTASQSLTEGEVDYFSFSGVADDVAELTLAPTAGFPGGSAPQLRVYTPNGRDLGAFTGDSVIPLSLPVTGDYVVRVSANTLFDTGSYDLSLECLPPNGIDHVGDDSITPKDITVPAGVDCFSFDGTAGEIVELILAQTAGFAGSFATAELFAPSGLSLGTLNTVELKEFTLPETGGAATGNPYTVKTQAANGSATGSYNFALERRQAPGGGADPDPQSPPLVCGQLIPASIDEAGEVDYYRFDASAGDQVQLTLVQSGFVGGTVVQATLFSPGGANLGTHSANGIGAYTLPDTGTYAVRVINQHLIYTGDYSIGLECVVPLGPVEAHLVPGDLVSDSLALSGEVDYFTFDGSIGDQVQLALTQSGFVGGTWAYAVIYAPSGAVVDDFTANTIRPVTLPEDGTYAVRVNNYHYVYTGSYNLGLESVSPLGPVEAHLEPGDLLGGSIVESGEADYFTFDGNTGDQVQLALTQAGFVGGTWAYAVVYAPSDVIVDTFTANTIRPITLPEDGTYAVRVTNYHYYYTGSYNLGLESVSPLGPVEAHLVPGDLVDGSIVQSGEADYFTFDGSTNDQVQLALTQSGFTGGTWAYAAVYAPSGALVDTFTANTIRPLTLTEDGTYAVRVTNYHYYYTGSYSLGLESVNPLGPVEAHLTPGDLLTSSIDQSGEADYFTFDGNTGDQVQLALTQSGFPGGTWAYAAVYAPTGALVDTFTANTIRPLTLPEDGTYAVRVTEYHYYYTGSYNLGLESLSPLGPVVAHLTSGSLVSDSIDQSGEADYFTFTGNVDDSVDLTLTQSGFAGGTWAYAALYAPSGALIDTFTANALESYTLTESGTYVVRVTEYSYYYTGNYTIGLTLP